MVYFEECVDIMTFFMYNPELCMKIIEIDTDCMESVKVITSLVTLDFSLRKNKTFLSLRNMIMLTITLGKSN